MSNMHFLGISGSLRRGSYNTALLRAAVELLPDGVTMDIFDLTPIPMYNRDIEVKGLPRIVQKFNVLIAKADALIIASPEYNHSVSGALKNAIDWASRRPPGETVSVLHHKPLAIASVATGQFGGLLGQSHLHDIAIAVNMHVLNRPYIIVSNAREKFDEHGYLTDETTRRFLSEMLVSLQAWTLQLQFGVAAKGGR